MRRVERDRLSHHGDQSRRLSPQSRHGVGEQPIVEKAETDEEEVFENLRQRFGRQTKIPRLGFELLPVSLMSIGSREPVLDRVKHCFAPFGKERMRVRLTLAAIFRASAWLMVRARSM